MSQSAIPAGAGALPKKFPDWLAAALILLATITAYLPALRDGYIWDDDQYVTENATLRDLHGLKRIWTEPAATPQYYPLVHTGFWVEYHLWGLNPAGYHAVNILLHALAAILLRRVLRKLHVPGAWLAALVFALHPVMVESVAWVTERKNVLSAVFYFAAALAYLRFAGLEGRDSKPETRNLKLWYFAALGLFVCALLSKTVTCSLPAALLLVLWWRKGRLTIRDVLPTLPFFAIGAALGWHTAHLEKIHVGASGPEWAFTFADRCLIAGRALWFYAGKLLWPAKLTFIYPRWEISTAVWWQWLFPLAAVGVVAALFFFRKRLGRGPLVAVLLFAGTLFPALGFFNVYPMRYSFVADHFQYHASVGLIVLASVGFWRLSARFGLPKAGVILLLGLAVLTWRQTRIYHDQETLWRDTLAKNPACWMAHNNLGLVLADRQDLAGAEDHYRKAFDLRPGYSEALNNLGTIMLYRGRLPEAAGYFEKAFEADPDYADSLSNLGLTFFKMGNTNDALATLRRAMGIDSNSIASLVNLGSMLMACGNFAEAEPLLKKLLEVKPGHIEARLNHVIALISLGKTDQAVLQLKEGMRFVPNEGRFCVELAKISVDQGRVYEAIDYYFQAAALIPKDAVLRYNLAVLLTSVGKMGGAVEQYRAAIQINPDYAEACNNLAVVFINAGKLDQALNFLENALRLKPDYAEAHNNLAYALLKSGRREEAISHLRRALKLNPNYAAPKLQLREIGEAEQ